MLRVDSQRELEAFESKVINLLLCHGLCDRFFYQLHLVMLYSISNYLDRKTLIFRITATK